MLIHTAITIKGFEYKAATVGLTFAERHVLKLLKEGRLK